MSGLLKVSDTRLFRIALEGYGILPAPAIAPLAYLLPPLEIITGLCLLTGQGLRGAWLWSQLLYAGFFLATIHAKVRGLEVDCGCFGPLHVKISWGHAVFCLLAALMARRQNNKGCSSCAEQPFATRTKTT